MKKILFTISLSLLISLPSLALTTNEDPGDEMRQTFPSGTRAPKPKVQPVPVPQGDFTYQTLTAGVYEAELSDYPGIKCYYRLSVTAAVPDPDWVLNRPAHLELNGPLVLPNKNSNNCPIYGETPNLGKVTAPLEFYCDSKERGKLGEETLLKDDGPYLREKGVDVSKIECWFATPHPHSGGEDTFVFQRSEKAFEVFQVGPVRNSLLGVRELIRPEGGFQTDRLEEHRKVFTRISN